jgi:NTE family protein
VAGHALSSIFLDNLGADLERLQRINQVLRLVPRERQLRHRELTHVDALVLYPSRDLGELATHHGDRLPAGVRYLLRGLGSTEGSGANLLSYLLFDRQYCRELLALGYTDALARSDEIQASFPVTPPASCRCFRRCCCAKEPNRLTREEFSPTMRCGTPSSRPALA